MEINKATSLDIEELAADYKQAINALEMLLQFSFVVTDGVYRDASQHLAVDCIKKAR
jgi:hypothetical protein